MPPTPSLPLSFRPWLRRVPLMLAALFNLLAGAGLAVAAAPADAQIKAVLDDVQRFETQLAGNPSPNAATRTRTLRLIGLTRERLNASPNRTHASWVEADSRLNALVARLEAPATSPASAPPASAPAPAAPAASAPAAPGGARMISQDRVRIQKLNRDIVSATQTLDHQGPRPFQDPDYVAQQQRRLENFRASLEAYADFAGDPDVVAAGESLATFERMLAFGREHAAKATAGIGDVQAGLAALDAARAPLPSPPAQPFAPSATQTWLDSLAQRRAHAAAALEQLAVYRHGAHLPIQPGTVSEGAPYDMQDVERLEHAYRSVATDIEQQLEQFAIDLDAGVAHIRHTLEFLAGLDPADSSDQANGFLGAGATERVRGQIQSAVELVEVAVDFDRRLRRDAILAEHTAMLDRIQSARAAYDANLARARELVRLPKAASTDRTLVGIARETLQKPEYEVGEIRRLVISTDRVRREKQTSEARFDQVDVSLSGTVTLTGTETTYHYVWDEFQVATAERVGDTFFIYHNTLKYFTSGATTTPLNRWILAGRFQGSEIPEANIDRD